MTKHEDKTLTPIMSPHHEQVLDAAMRLPRWHTPHGDEGHYLRDQEGAGTPERKRLILTHISDETRQWEDRAYAAKTELLQTRMEHTRAARQIAEFESSVWKHIHMGVALLGAGFATLGVTSAALLVMHRRARS